MKPLIYEEFYEQMWDYISKRIVSDHYFFSNEDMMRSITKDVYDIYVEEMMHPKYYAGVVESVFFNLFKYQVKEDKDYNSCF